MEGLSAYENGGKGSGNFGHSGRPGKVGGSGNGKGAKSEKNPSYSGDKEQEAYTPEQTATGSWYSSPHVDKNIQFSTKIMNPNYRDGLQYQYYPDEDAVDVDSQYDRENLERIILASEAVRKLNDNIDYQKIIDDADGNPEVEVLAKVGTRMGSLKPEIADAVSYVGLMGGKVDSKEFLSAYKEIADKNIATTERVVKSLKKKLEKASETAIGNQRRAGINQELSELAVAEQIISDIKKVRDSYKDDSPIKTTRFKFASTKVG